MAHDSQKAGKSAARECGFQVHTRDEAVKEKVGEKSVRAAVVRGVRAGEMLSSLAIEKTRTSLCF